jgi:GTP-binding protein EngB required for normal cell division
MQLTRPIRVLLALGITLALLLIMAAALLVTESLFSVWDRLRESPPWLGYGYAGAVGLIALLGGWTVWRLLMPKPHGARAEKPLAPPTQAQLDEQIVRAEAAGMDVEAARSELQHLAKRRASGEIYVAVFGDISTGKSSLIRALAPQAQPQISVRGGSTGRVDHYQWSSPAADRLVLADLPGLNAADGTLDTVARDEALRAHVVVYVCDGDLTRSQFRELQTLLALGKPTVVAVNKTDRYTPQELAQVRSRVAERLADANNVEVVTVVAGGMQQVVRMHADGREETIDRPVKPDVEALQSALQRRIDASQHMLEQLRDSAVFVLVSQKLTAAQSEHRRERAEEIVRQYTRKAVVGALASVSPGADIVVQGYLGTNMVKELCELYETPARSLDIERFLDFVQSVMGKTIPVFLALAGNTLKAFPGAGTVAGGLAHAVAYGLIFDAVGTSVRRTLESRGELRPATAATLFKESLGEDLEGRARRLITLAMASKREKDRDV